MKIEIEEVLARQTYAKILSFCKAKRLRADGKLKEALQTQQIGRVCLHDLNQTRLQRPLLDVEICITKRLLAGNSYQEKKEVLNDLERLLKEFKHTSIQYYKKVLIEKGTVLTQMLEVLKSSSNKDKANDKIKEISEATQKCLEELDQFAKDTQWQWRVHLLESRKELAEKNYTSAMRAAEAALDAVKRTPHKSGLIQAELQRARIYRSQSKYADAIDIFEKILELCRKNDLTYSFCHLSLAECYLLKAEQEEVAEDIQYSFEHWIIYKGIGSENGNVIAMAERLQDKFKGLEESFFIPKWNNQDSINLNIEKNFKELRKWLHIQAELVLESRNEPTTNENLSKILGYSSQSSITYHKNKKKNKKSL